MNKKISAMNSSGEELSHHSIHNTSETKYHLGNLPENAKLVIELSSVWKAPYHQICDELGWMSSCQTHTPQD